MPDLRVAVDVGGTFTDICILDEEDGTIDVAKVPSTADPIDAVVSGVVEAGIDYAGNVVTPLDEDEARRVAYVLRKRGVETVAVCFINSYANPAHELRM